MTVKIFASIGVIATFIVVIMFVALISSGIDVLVNNRRYNKRIKNRFKGGPTAKCFCKDCTSYREVYRPDKCNHGAGDCKVHAGRRVQDNWYCWAATPVDYDEAKRRKEIEDGR